MVDARQFSLVALVFVGMTVAPMRVRAHQAGISRAEVRVHAGGLALDLVFARPELVALVPGADRDHDGVLDEIELLSLESVLGEEIRGGVHASIEEVACEIALDRLAFVEEDGLAAFLTCPGRAGPKAVFSVGFPLLARLAPGHRMLARVHFASEGAQPIDLVLHRRRPLVTLRWPVASGEAEAAREAPAVLAVPRGYIAWLVLALGLFSLGIWFFRRHRAYSRDS